MANLTSKDMGFKIDSSTGVLTDIAQYVNSQSLNQAQTILDDSGMGETQHTQIPGMVAAASLPINGMVNTTTEGIFGPAAVNGTSITKTVEFNPGTGMYYNGEFWIQDYAVSGTPDTLEVFSCTLAASDAINRTSVAL